MVCSARNGNFYILVDNVNGFMRLRFLPNEKKRGAGIIPTPHLPTLTLPSLEMDFFLLKSVGIGFRRFGAVPQND